MLSRSDRIDAIKRGCVASGTTPWPAMLERIDMALQEIGAFTPAAVDAPVEQRQMTVSELLTQMVEALDKHRVLPAEYISDLTNNGPVTIVPDPPEPEPERAVEVVEVSREDIQTAHDLLAGLQLGDKWRSVYELRERLLAALTGADGEGQ